MTAVEHFQTIEADVRSKNKKIVLVLSMSVYGHVRDFSVEEIIQKISASVISILCQQTVEAVYQCIHLQNFL